MTVNLFWHCIQKSLSVSGTQKGGNFPSLSIGLAGPHELVAEIHKVIKSLILFVPEFVFMNTVLTMEKNDLKC